MLTAWISQAPCRDASLSAARQRVGWDWSQLPGSIPHVSSQILSCTQDLLQAESAGNRAACATVPA